MGDIKTTFGEHHIPKVYREPYKHKLTFQKFVLDIEQHPNTHVVNYTLKSFDSKLFKSLIFANY